MDVQTLLKTNAVKAGELVLAVGEAAGAVAKAIEEATGPIAEMLEEKAGALAKNVEARALPLADALGARVETLTKTVEERAAPLAGAVGTGVEALTGDLEKRFAQATRGVKKNAKNVRFGTREGMILGVVLGIFAALWVFRRMDRQAARERLTAAGSRMGARTQAIAGRVGEAAEGVTSRVGPAAQELTSKMGEATHELADKAGALASQAGERMGQVVQTVGARAGEMLQQVRGGQADEADPTHQAFEDVKKRLSDATAHAREVVISDSREAKEPVAVLAESGLNQETQEAINNAIQEAQRAHDETLVAARNLGLSNGMKVVAFDGAEIGRVQEVREDVFVLNRPRGADLLVPLTEIARIEGTVAHLRIEIGQVAKIGWETADPS